MSNTIEKIQAVMATVFATDIKNINENSSPDNIENSSPDNIENWDSIRHLNLAVALEETFSIELTEEDIMELMNFKLIELKVIEKLNNA